MYKYNSRYVEQIFLLRLDYHKISLKTTVSDFLNTSSFDT